MIENKKKHWLTFGNGSMTGCLQERQALLGKHRNAEHEVNSNIKSGWRIRSVPFDDPDPKNVHPYPVQDPGKNSNDFRIWTHLKKDKTDKKYHEYIT